MDVTSTCQCKKKDDSGRPVSLTLLVLEAVTD